MENVTQLKLTIYLKEPNFCVVLPNGQVYWTCQNSKTNFSRFFPIDFPKIERKHFIHLERDTPFLPNPQNETVTQLLFYFQLIQTA